jgi:hypothetical protein
MGRCTPLRIYWMLVLACVLLLTDLQPALAIAAEADI